MSGEEVTSAVAPPGETPPVPLFAVDPQDKLYVELMWSLQSRGGIAHLVLITKDMFNEEELQEPLRTPFFGMLCYLIDKGEVVKAGRGNYALASMAGELNLQNVSKYPDFTTPKGAAIPAQPQKLRMPDRPHAPRRHR